MANLPEKPSREQREARLLVLLPEGRGRVTHFSELALGDERLIEVLFAACQLEGPEGYDLGNLSEEELAYLETCCEEPSYLRPNSALIGS